MKLGVLDRLTLLNVLPPEGDLLTIRIVHGLRQRLSFTEEEHAALKFTKSADGQQILWKKEADKEVDIEIGSKAEQIIRDRLNELSNQKKLTEMHISICEKFLGTTE
jgi:hypothetical protein